MALLYRDPHGVPHVRATSVLDLAHAQGRVTAIDRAWQLEHLRRRAAGTTAEVLGAGGLGWDVLARRLEVEPTARRAFDACTDETRAFVAAYADGVNHGLAQGAARAPELRDLGVTPGEWRPWTPLATFLAQHVLFGSIGAQLWRRRLHDALGDDGVRLLRYEGPVAAGSNAWGVGGARTASGRPLVAGDPHRTIEQPGVYQQVRLACESPEGGGGDRFDVVGFAFVGVPGVQHFAHAGEVAWAITNGVADYQDLHDELDPPREVVSRRAETIAVRGDDGPGTSVEVEVVQTPHGLLLEPGLSVRTSSWVLGDLGFDALLPLLRSRSADDVDAALDRWVEPVNNVVVADRGGALRYRLAGRVPVRDDDGTWTGWLTDVHRDEQPPSGQVVTANDRRGPQSDEVGGDFGPPHRARRIAALLDGRDGLTPSDVEAMQRDTLLATVPLLAALVPAGFDGFDGRMEAGSAPAARFAAWRTALVRRVVAHPALAPLLDPPAPYRHPSLHGVLDPWLDPVSRIALALPTLAAARTPFGIDLPGLAREALDEVDADPATPSSWGATHVLEPVHALDVHGRAHAAVPAPALSGDTDCVCCTGSYPAITDACTRGSVARYVWCLADREAGGWVVPTGASGVPADPHHHDQTASWAAGRLVPIVTDWSRLTPVEW